MLRPGAAKFAQLLADAGWQLERVRPTDTGLSVIEAVAADGLISG
jgi:hypothetical protein